jgi:hypothetical protein
MILTYADGSKTDAVLLARSDNKLRVVVPGSEDPMELTLIHGTWVSEDCEPITVEFAWQRKTREEIRTEADCLCSQELAARLIHLLWSGDDEEKLQTEAPLAAGGPFATMAAHRGN